MSSSSVLWAQARELWLAALTARDPVIAGTLQELASEIAADAHEAEGRPGARSQGQPGRQPASTRSHLG